MIQVIIERDSSLPLVHCSLSLKEGSLTDPPGKEGLTRLLLRLMRRTAGGAEPLALDEQVDQLGAALWADVGQSNSGVYGNVISRNLLPFFELFQSVVLKPGLSEEEFQRLRRETESELVEVLDSDRSLARRWFARKLFEGHAYSRPTSGTKQSLARISHADLLERYRDIFRPENIYLSFAGDITQEQAEAFAQQIQTGLPAGVARQSSDPEHPSPPKGRHLAFVNKPERSQTQIIIGGLGTYPHDPDHFALQIANTVFGGTFTARLTQEVRAKRGWSYGAYSSLSIDRRRRSFSMWTFPKAEDASACIQLELELLRTWVEQGITQEELDWAKRYLVRSHAFAIDSASKRVGQLLEVQLYDLPENYHKDYINHVESVTLEQVNQSLRRISPDDLWITVVGTAEPLFEQLKAEIPELASSVLIPYDAE